jgi:peptidylprolyl isomerase domain and WD repeat-containing protein 1
MKRARSESHSSSSAEAGPARPANLDQPARKPRPPLANEAQLLARLPSAHAYEKSYMHRAPLTATATTTTGFVVTGSSDGMVKIWRKNSGGIEFVKLFRAHLGSVVAIVVSPDGLLAASLGDDKYFKVFDVVQFDMIAMHSLGFVPEAAAFCYTAGRPVLAVAERGSRAVRTYDAQGAAGADGLAVPLFVSEGVHSAPVVAMAYNTALDVVVSADARGVIEYWVPEDGTPPPCPAVVAFKFKSDTDLFDAAKKKAKVTSLAVTRDGAKFAAMGSDGLVRVYRFKTAKITRVYDQSLAAITEEQRAGATPYRLDGIDFGRRVAREKELATTEHCPPSNLVWDDSGHFLVLPTLLGIVVLNTHSNTVARVLGHTEAERFLGISLTAGQGAALTDSAILAAAAQGTTPAAIAGELDPTIFACALKRQRFYCFSRREPAESAADEVGRDVLNEKPTRDDAQGKRKDGPGGAAAGGAAAGAGPSGTSAVIHTTKGDIHVALHRDECPRTFENWTTHAKGGYYDGVIFHRVIRGFMIQTGDPLGNGTGGKSIWGGEFEDEIHRNLKHDRPGVLSMANAGPNTNGSQFFITTVPTPWLDGKHTVFGRVTKGMDVVHDIEKAKTVKDDKPAEDIKILNITLS